MQIDWKKESGPKVFVGPDQPYLVEIIEVTFGESSTKKTPRVEITGRIIKPEDCEGETTKDYLNLLESSAWRIALFLKACLAPFDPADLPVMSTEGEDFKHLMRSTKGRKMWWNLKKDTYDGKESMKPTQRDPYAPFKDNPPWDESSIEGDVPDWVKSQV